MLLQYRCSWANLTTAGRSARFWQQHRVPTILQPCRQSTDFTSSWPGCTSRSLSSNATYKVLEQKHNKSRNGSGLHDKSSLVLSPAHGHQDFQPSTFRHASSNTRWVNRQKGDRFAREAKVQNLKSRAAFKLLQINDRYRIFRPGMTVVDLGFAPGSWSQVAIDLVRPGLGRVVGVDIIPVAPPRGVNGVQGDFLSLHTQERVRDLIRDESAGRVRRPEDAAQDDSSYFDRERAATSDDEITKEHNDKVVDVVLSDMSAPWEITSGLWKNSLSNPYYRLMNTSGNRFADHAGSMDLCRSALYFAFETLKIGGHFVCKFYQGAEDKTFEKQLKAMFSKVHREKPESSRPESKESFFVGIKRLAKVDKNAVFDEGS